MDPGTPTTPSVHSKEGTSSRVHSTRSKEGSHHSARSRSQPRDVPTIRAPSPTVPQAISTMSARSERRFFPSSGEIGLAQHDEDICHETQIADTAGVPSAEVAYHESSHCFPRFERQQIRALLDQTLVSGERQVDPGILRRIPSMHKPLQPVEQKTSARSLSCASKASTRSTRSTRSSSSHGSWLRQTEFSARRYKTNNAEYGSYPEVNDTGNLRGFHPGFGNGRELWQLGRTKGRNTSDFENCLVDNNRYVPFLQ